MMPASDARNKRGEYIRWLHIFCMDRKSDSLHMANAIGSSGHFSVPWLWEPVLPKLDEIEALWHITRFAELPGRWHDFWYGARFIACESRDLGVRGPYWMLTSASGLNTVAQITSQLKREIAKEYFLNSVKSAPGVTQSETLYRRLSPYLMIPTGDSNDETERTGQVRRRALQEWYGTPLNRPPGSR